MHKHEQEDKGKVKPPKKPTQHADQHPAGEALDRMPAQIDPQTVRRMQRTLGNRAVQRYLVQRSGEGATDLDDETAAAIESRRGQGGALDDSFAAKAGETMGADFSEVNVHTDAQADKLSRQVNAEAFTTGNDIFFRSGNYDPHSSSGQQLLAHELTHVVQQGGSAPVQAKMTVNDPDDQYEKEADQVAEQVAGQPEPVQLQEMEEEEMVQAQPVEEEEEMMQP